jgi:hypothetical protein
LFQPLGQQNLEQRLIGDIALVRQDFHTACSTARRSRNQTCFVGAGLVPALRKGTHEGCPHERRKMFA